MQYYFINCKNNIGINKKKRIILNHIYFLNYRSAVGSDISSTHLNIECTVVCYIECVKYYYIINQS